MNFYRLGILLGMLFLLGISSVKADSLSQKIKVKVNGMVCAFCAQGVKKTFKKNDAVEKIDVDLEQKVVTIDLKKGKTLNDDVVQKSITDAGFNVEKIERVK